MNCNSSSKVLKYCEQSASIKKILFKDLVNKKFNELSSSFRSTSEITPLLLLRHESWQQSLVRSHSEVAGSGWREKYARRSQRHPGLPLQGQVAKETEGYRRTGFYGEIGWTSHGERSFSSVYTTHTVEHEQSLYIHRGKRWDFVGLWKFFPSLFLGPFYFSTS